jgi:hypothetical protein
LSAGNYFYNIKKAQSQLPNGEKPKGNPDRDIRQAPSGFIDNKTVLFYQEWLLYARVIV